MYNRIKNHVGVFISFSSKLNIWYVWCDVIFFSCLLFELNSIVEYISLYYLWVVKSNEFFDYDVFSILYLHYISNITNFQLQHVELMNYLKMYLLRIWYNTSYSNVYNESDWSFSLFFIHEPGKYFTNNLTKLLFVIFSL